MVKKLYKKKALCIKGQCLYCMSSDNELTGEMTTLLENLSDSVGRMESAPINRIQQGEIHNTVTCTLLCQIPYLKNGILINKHFGYLSLYPLI